MKKTFSKIKAFTLSEMVIALGIIGVIAALTMPSVVYNVNNRANSALLKKAVVKLNDVVELSMSESRFQPYPKCYYSRRINPGSGDYSQCQELYAFMKENLRTIKICDSNGVSEGCIPQYKGKDTVFQEQNPPPESDATQAEKDKYADEMEKAINGCEGFSYDSMKSKPAIVTSDGIILIPYNNSFSGWPIFAVDVNGKKSPNRFGYDVFFLKLSGDPGEIPSFEPETFCAYYEKGGYTTQEMLNFTKERFE